MARAKQIELIVRRGALRRFHKLKQKTAGLPVQVSWDRRTSSDRRSASDGAGANRPKVDRRQKPPFTWELSDFVVAAKPPRGKKKHSE